MCYIKYRGITREII